MKWTPHKYQQKAIKFGLSRSNAGFFLSPGLGKTSIILAIFKILQKQGFVKGALVVAPFRTLRSVWEAEVEKWRDFDSLSVGILHGPDKGVVLKEKHDIWVTNYESLEWLNGALSKLKKWPFDLLVVDESSKVKNMKTQRVRALKGYKNIYVPMLPKFKYRYILTGSPAANSLLDLFGQCYVMDSGATFGPYITHYRNKFFNSVGYGGFTYVPKPNAEKEIFARLAPRVLRMAAEDYLELPELLIRDVVVELPDKAMRIYKQMESQLRVDFEAGRVTAANAAVASMKLRQISNGGIYLTPDTWQNIHTAKSDTVLDIIEELQGQPALVIYDFHHDLERLKKALGKDTPHIGSGVTAKRGEEYARAWNKGELKVLLGHPQSMGHGLNLQGSDTGGSIIIHSLPWSFELYDQLIARVWRQGQKKRVVVHRILAKGTIDFTIAKTLVKKERTQNSLFNALKDYFQ